METAIRWSPSSTTSAQRFLIADVVGRTFTHCRIVNHSGRDVQYEILSTHRKVPAFRAFDWSAHDEAIIAVGQWSGEATVLRIDDGSQALSLPIKHQRLCNAVAFSKTGLLATGLERVRNDFCLNVWDIKQRISTAPSQSPRTGKQLVEPVRKLASSEAITSIKFFGGQPDNLIAGVKGTCVRIYDLRESMGNPSMQFQTACVHNIAIDPLDENYFASAGPLKDTTIHIWDRRSGTRSTVASPGAGAGSNVQHGPILELKNVIESSNTAAQASIWSLRFCKGQPGCLGVLASTGQYQVFETKREHTPEALPKARNGTEQVDISIHPQPIFTDRIHHVEKSIYGNQPSYDETKRIVSFDFTNLAGSRGRPCAIVLRGDQSIEIDELRGPPSALATSPRGEFLFGNINDDIGNGSSNIEREILNCLVHVVKPRMEGTIAESLKATRTQMAENKANKQHGIAPENESVKRSQISSDEAHEDLYQITSFKSKLSIEDALVFSTVLRRRCAEGYLFDCRKNIEIVADDTWLQDMWTWISRRSWGNTLLSIEWIVNNATGARADAEDDGMVTDSLDMSYVGVFGIWNNDLGPNTTARSLSRNVSKDDMSNAVESLCKRLQLPEFGACETAFPMHRQLCLHTCGLGLPYQQLEDTVKDLVSKGQNTRAAALAIIHDNSKLAFQALRNGKATAAHRELSLALAGYVKGTTNDNWDETIQELVKDLDDPYARAILALVSYGDWHDVLAETSLPLKDRLGIALMYLPDAELTHFITTTTASAISRGSIEGIVLTGLTEKALPLYEAYIHKFADIQTAVLALSFTYPRYYSTPSSALFTLWRETYRGSLNTHRMFTHRVHFDIQSTKVSTPLHSQKPTLPPDPRQITLRCDFCDQSLDRNPSHSTPPQPTTTTPIPSSTHSGSIFSDAKSGTVCPKCARHMPRCAICMLWVGKPDPHTRGGAATAAAKKSDPMAAFVSVCQRCWHVFHGDCAENWFLGREGCAVPDCECRCARLDG